MIWEIQLGAYESSIVGHFTITGPKGDSTDLNRLRDMILRWHPDLDTLPQFLRSILLMSIEHPFIYYLEVNGFTFCRGNSTWRVSNFTNWCINTTDELIFDTV